MWTDPASRPAPRTHAANDRASSGRPPDADSDPCPGSASARLGSSPPAFLHLAHRASRRPPVSADSASGDARTASLSRSCRCGGALPPVLVDHLGCVARPYRRQDHVVKGRDRCRQLHEVSPRESGRSTEAATCRRGDRRLNRDAWCACQWTSARRLVTCLGARSA